MPPERKEWYRAPPVPVMSLIPYLFVNVCVRVRFRVTVRVLGEVARSFALSVRVAVFFLSCCGTTDRGMSKI